MTNMRIDTANQLGKLNDIWNMGFNTCHAELLIRYDLNTHLKMGSEIGFKYIRFHNIFSEMVGVYNEDEQGKPVFNFQKFDQIYDNIIKHHLIPFLKSVSHLKR